jgi:hypothetical protein
MYPHDMENQTFNGIIDTIFHETFEDQSFILKVLVKNFYIMLQRKALAFIVIYFNIITEKVVFKIF